MLIVMCWIKQGLRVKKFEEATIIDSEAKSTALFFATDAGNY